MKTLTLQSEIDGDGKLRLEVPCDLPPGPVEVVLVIQPSGSTARTAPPFDLFQGAWVGRFPSDFDVDLALKQIDGNVRRQWEVEP